LQSKASLVFRKRNLFLNHHIASALITSSDLAFQDILAFEDLYKYKAPPIFRRRIRGGALQELALKEAPSIESRRPFLPS
jgi:hypothetical protein